jgi:hypothetical protein
MRPLATVLLLLLVGCSRPQRGDSLLDDLQKLPPAKIETALPNHHPSAYYGYAIRLFDQGKKDDAVFWYYVGQLRYRFHLKANPNLEPSGDPAAFSALSATIGPIINPYAGGSVREWGKAIDRALQWDAAVTNGFTSKEKFAAIYEENRAGLKKMREQLDSQANAIRAQRKKAGLEVRD